MKERIFGYTESNELLCDQIIHIKESERTRRVKVNPSVGDFVGVLLEIKIVEACLD